MGNLRLLNRNRRVQIYAGACNTQISFYAGAGALGIPI